MATANPTTEPPDVELHARRLAAELAAELRRIDDRLADLVAQAPEPASDLTATTVASPIPGERPPTPLDALLGAASIAREHVAEALGVLRTAGEITPEQLTEIWRARRDDQRQRDAAGLAGIWAQLERRA